MPYTGLLMGLMTACPSMPSNSCQTQTRFFVLQAAQHLCSLHSTAARTFPALSYAAALAPSQAAFHRWWISHVPLKCATATPSASECDSPARWRVGHRIRSPTDLCGGRLPLRHAHTAQCPLACRAFAGTCAVHIC